jgi:hypothetical protein
LRAGSLLLLTSLKMQVASGKSKDRKIQIEVLKSFIHNVINKCAYRTSEQSRPKRDKPKKNAGMQSYDVVYRRLYKSLICNLKLVTCNLNLAFKRGAFVEVSSV